MWPFFSGFLKTQQFFKIPFKISKRIPTFAAAKIEWNY